MSSVGSLGTADIVGIAVGGALTLVTIVGIIISCYALCRKQNNPSPVYPMYPPPPNYQQNPYGQPVNSGYYPQQAYRSPQQQQQQYWTPQTPTPNPPSNSYYTPKSNY